MAGNIAADRLQELLVDARCEELANAEPDRRQRPGEERTTDNSGPSLLSLLEDSLSEAGNASLESLARSAVLLGCFSPSLSSSSPSPPRSMNESLPARILDLSRQTFRLEDQISSIETLTSDLQAQTTQTLHDLSAVRARAAQLSNPEDTMDSRPSTPPHASSICPTTDYSYLHAQTLQHQRETKQLQLKSAEYKARIDVLERLLSATGPASSNVPSTAALVSKQQILDEKKNRIAALEARFKEFHGLPPDIVASRREVNRLQTELETLKRRRDELFERI
jgi:septal ring factor EnvC (AmiA/AmiB activator)